MLIKEKIAESGHWYTKDGTPAYSVVGANGSNRPTTLRDARKMGLLPSVTGIIRQLSSAGLDLWKQQQVLLAALTLPRLENEPEQEWLARVMQDSKATGREAAERGTAIHAIIQSYFDQIYLIDKPIYIDNILTALKSSFGEHDWVA